MPSPRIERLEVGVYRVPTEGPEADGTLRWDATTVVVVHVHAAGVEGLGWTYSSPAAAAVITHHLRDVVVGRDAADLPGAFDAMNRACRNLGTRGLVAQAVSAVDIALWDLRAHLRDLPLATLFGRCHSAVPIYGSGGFTNLDDAELAKQVDEWRDAGCTAMKIKIGQCWGSDTERDLARVNRLRELAGETVELMVDANGAYSAGQARRVGAALDRLGVTWFEEPVSSDDTEGLAAVRSAVRCDVAAGEYISDRYGARRLAPVVDCLQLDVTRCGGYSGWLAAASIAAAHNLEVSAHCAPALHVPVTAAIPRLRHLEYFIDHTRLEAEMFDGVPVPSGGRLPVTTTRSGHGMSLAARAEKYREEMAS
ncbi:enolase superfamily enzyme related to L-alanine-DL-glutamate epimerase [Mycolicibacterium chubuense NBB4]|uniref:Enolase superfamily enzyme related to L-alanine-DL-glutamate epimerase n=1 Tax=Mycolicibacterium chubuense (strain NBB4) TaxID=710421 RepID=I4BRM4_MYCCN|nr:enolase C-terminal domain-like protein [Mycolicibacterium chubuense]AFM19931.1 enolase superfamily enzyme related to L-alanine-DL-glutamate epimerase [Mycolicibacterium chubuense NBB4]